MEICWIFRALKGFPRPRIRFDSMMEPNTENCIPSTIWASNDNMDIGPELNRELQVVYRGGIIHLKQLTQIGINSRLAWHVNLEKPKTWKVWHKTKIL